MLLHRCWLAAFLVGISSVCVAPTLPPTSTPIRAAPSATKSAVTFIPRVQQQPGNSQRQQQSLAPLQSMKQHRKRSLAAGESTTAQPILPQCETFVMGDPNARMLFSPSYPNNYPNSTDCVTILQAPAGHLIRLDFRDYFNIEPSEECKFDYLEIRDGAHGFSTLIGQFCGTDFPPMITSRERHLWLRFHSDENIEYNGFVAVYEYIPRPTSYAIEETDCLFNVEGNEGFITNGDIDPDFMTSVRAHGQSLDCMWVVNVDPGWQIMLAFLKFNLEKPNECHQNFVDVFSEKTEIPSRLNNFCGSIADSVVSPGHVLHIRFFADKFAINSTFNILFTAFRDKSNSECMEGVEYDCEDNTCISKDLVCNKRSNCRFGWDEDDCGNKDAEQSEHVIIIIIVFGLILSGLVAAFLVNCIRKLIRDQKIIREHIRQSKESKLDELGRHSVKQSRDDLSIKLSPRDKHSQSTINILDDISNRFFREMHQQSSAHDSRGTGDTKSEHNSRNQEIKGVLEASHRGGSEKSLNSTDSYPGGGGNMCDMACQTRESLFAPVFKSKSSQPHLQHQQSGQGTIRFSTFGYDTPIPQAPPPPIGFVQPSTHSHIHHSHSHSHQQPPSAGKSAKTRTAATNIELEDMSGGPHAANVSGSGNKRPPIKLEESRAYVDIRNSAPDVIIMTSH